MSQKPDPDPKAPASEDLGRVMDAAKSEAVPERIVTLAKRLNAAIKAKSPGRKDP